MASDKEKRIEQRKRRNKAKKNVKTVIMVSIFTALGLLALIAGLFYWYSLKNLGTIAYPTSPLSKMMDASYSYVTSEDLPVSITCPNMPISLSVSGEEMYVSNNGTVFSYGGGLYISVYEVSTTPSGILNSQYGYDLCKGAPVGTPHFVLGAEDIGYFNGYAASYMCGKIELLSPANKSLQDIYVVTMTLDVNQKDDLMIGVATTDEKQMYDASVLVQNICYTIMDISSSNYLDTMKKVDEAVVVQQEVINPNVDAIDEGIEAEPEPEPVDNNDPYAGISSWDAYSIMISEDMESADFILHYSEKAVSPMSVVLVSPVGDIYSPTYYNDGFDGRIYVTIPMPMQGEWLYRVKTMNSLGNVVASVLPTGTQDVTAPVEGIDGQPIEGQPVEGQPVEGQPVVQDATQPAPPAETPPAAPAQ